MKKTLNSTWSKKLIEAETVGNKVVVRLANDRKQWVAEITGAHSQYKLDRSFVKLSSCPVDGYTDQCLVSDGIYQACVGNERTFFAVDNGRITIVSEQSVMHHVEGVASVYDDVEGNLKAEDYSMADADYEANRAEDANPSTTTTTATVNTPAVVDTYCHKCHSHCYGDCTASMD